MNSSDGPVGVRDRFRIPQEQEQNLLLRARRGDREAFVELLKPYQERVYGVAFKLLGNREDAAEVAQESFLRTFWKITGFRAEAHFYTWLYRITLNLCYERLARRERDGSRAVPPNPEDSPDVPSPELQLADPAASPREQAARGERIALVRQALARLEEKDFQLLILREFDHLSYEELALALGVPLGTVMSRLHRARQALTDELKRMGVSGPLE